MPDENDVTTSYLRDLQIDNTKIDIFLVNGIKLTGVINHFDSGSIIYTTDQLIARSSIATIQKSR